MRLDKFLIKQAGFSRKLVLANLHYKQIVVNGVIATDREMPIGEFDDIVFAGEQLQAAQNPYYIMLNKPAGILSATRDENHKTAIDLISEPFAKQLHIAGRLDRATTGLLLLTNDGKWSRALTEPNKKVPKRYLVKTVYPFAPNTESEFNQGIYFKYENLTTSPAEIEFLSDTECILTIYEGRYHQVKRMFAAVSNRVESLHRLSIGNIELDKNLKPGEYRKLSNEEIKLFKTL